ncbi:hypothetical protein GCM10011344_01930 [Dokdonia pacifica]|uniref:Uncharacterized protein n=1 Tax=Dokdonia pacifica TaxID=1627892 RepID=A0A238ZB79_9FLAO|nr:hypothetical protein [Dokdonia pacifica]GGG05169.1 hypothetical protein GCM10011344_01930 [Dokdonia pacifica]SNR80033.1 hypothetical protein SAMN06265376_10353 [Dokdonia pacifica]
MRILLVAITMLVTTTCFGQKKKIKRLKKETMAIAMELYKSELASWHSTDVLGDELRATPNLGGYLSYTDGDETIAIYYDQSEDINILYELKYSQILELKEVYTLDTVPRKATVLEKRLLKTRNQARDLVQNNEDQFFSFYENVGWNFVPILIDNKVTVYSIAGPQLSGQVLIGNDYKFEFDKKDTLISKSKVHNSLLVYSYGSEENKTEQVMHNHIVEEYPIISETDICTLMLYEPYVTWKQHTVISDSYVSIFILKEKQLIVMTRKAWDKIYASDKD